MPTHACLSHHATRITVNNAGVSHHMPVPFAQTPDDELSNILQVVSLLFTVDPRPLINASLLPISEHQLDSRHHQARPASNDQGPKRSHPQHRILWRSSPVPTPRYLFCFQGIPCYVDESYWRGSQRRWYHCSTDRPFVRRKSFPLNTFFMCTSSCIIVFSGLQDVKDPKVFSPRSHARRLRPIHPQLHRPQPRRSGPGIRIHSVLVSCVDGLCCWICS
jgi:hypothetical protein